MDPPEPFPWPMSDVGCVKRPLFMDGKRHQEEGIIFVVEIKKRPTLRRAPIRESFWGIEALKEAPAWCLKVKVHGNTPSHLPKGPPDIKKQKFTFWGHAVDPPAKSLTFWGFSGKHNFISTKKFSSLKIRCPTAVTFWRHEYNMETKEPKELGWQVSHVAQATAWPRAASSSVSLSFWDLLGARKCSALMPLQRILTSQVDGATQSRMCWSFSTPTCSSQQVLSPETGNVRTAVLVDILQNPPIPPPPADIQTRSVQKMTDMLHGHLAVAQNRYPKWVALANGNIS